MRNYFFLIVLILGCSSSNTGEDAGKDLLPDADTRPVDASSLLDVLDVAYDGRSDTPEHIKDAMDIAEELPNEVLSDAHLDLSSDLGVDLGQEVDASDVATSDTPPDIQPEDLEPEVPEPVLSAWFLEPQGSLVVEEGTPVTFTAKVMDTVYAPEELTATFSSSLAGELWTGSPDSEDTVTFVAENLEAGTHTITLTAESPSGQTVENIVQVGICTTGQPETFDAPLESEEWQVYGDAYWDSQGWLEMTGAVQDKLGAIFNVSGKINPGDVAISFRIRTGGGTSTGADGFAMSVFDAEDVTELEGLIDAAHGGGGLGYGVSNTYGPWDGDALHVEIDTWYNSHNGTTELHTDPTTENHIAVCFNGDPGNCPFWTAVPSIEDMNWHKVTIETVDYHIIVTLDDQVVIDEDLPGFEFRGGYIGFTGSTGYYSNYHSFDDLWVVQDCLVPD